MKTTFGKVIFISGASSSGKTTLAAGLQQKLPEPFLHVQMDSFISMLPPDSDWSLFRKMVRGMNRSILAMAEEGNNLIVDTVLFERDWLLQCLELLHEHYVLFIGLHCPLGELERRERTRGPSGQGYARQQLKGIHKDRIYDIELDTGALEPLACEERVLDFYSNRQPAAFSKMWVNRT